MRSSIHDKMPAQPPHSHLHLYAGKSVNVEQYPPTTFAVTKLTGRWFHPVNRGARLDIWLPLRASDGPPRERRQEFRSTPGRIKTSGVLPALSFRCPALFLGRSPVGSHLTASLTPRGKRFFAGDSFCTGWRGRARVQVEIHLMKIALTGFKVPRDKPPRSGARPGRPRATPDRDPR
jgi:hypothetical protein